MGPGARSGSSGPAAAAAPRAAYYSESVPASGGPAAEPSSDSEAQAEPSGLFARKSDSEALTYRSLRPGCHTDSDVSVARARAGRPVACRGGPGSGTGNLCRSKDSEAMT